MHLNISCQHQLWWSAAMSASLERKRKDSNQRFVNELILDSRWYHVDSIQFFNSWPLLIPLLVFWRKCVWAMMLISILLILHVQRDRYIEALRWHGGIADHGPPLPWEVQPIILPNDTYEAAATRICQNVLERWCSFQTFHLIWIPFWNILDSCGLVSAHFILFSPISARFSSFRPISARFISFRLAWSCFISLGLVWYRIISIYHDLSYFTSFHLSSSQLAYFISFHLVWSCFIPFHLVISFDLALSQLLSLHLV